LLDTGCNPSFDPDDDVTKRYNRIYQMKDYNIQLGPIMDDQTR